MVWALEVLESIDYDPCLNLSQILSQKIFTPRDVKKLFFAFFQNFLLCFRHKQVWFLNKGKQPESNCATSMAECCASSQCNKRADKYKPEPEKWFETKTSAEN